MTCPYECYESEDACAEAGGWSMPEYSCVASFICDWFGTAYYEYSCDSGVCCSF